VAFGSDAVSYATSTSAAFTGPAPTAGAGSPVKVGACSSRGLTPLRRDGARGSVTRCRRVRDCVAERGGRLVFGDDAVQYESAAQAQTKSGSQVDSATRAADQRCACCCGARVCGASCDVLLLSFGVA
jgi:hypothetical protein